MRRRGVGRSARPGVLGTMARTAVVAGTATAVSGKVAQAQHARATQSAVAPTPADPPVAPEPAAPSGPSAETIERLTQLADLHQKGVLTDDEFATQKARLLA